MWIYPEGTRTAEWDGVIKARAFIPAGGIGTESDPYYSAQSGAFLQRGLVDNVSELINDAGYGAGGGGGSLWTSNAIYIYPIVGTQIISGAGLYTGGVVSGANITTLQNNYNITSGANVSLSSVYTAHAASEAIHFTSNAIYTAINLKANDAPYELTSGAVISLSSVYTAHAGDASDPHGATLTQTNLRTSGACLISGAIITSDFETMSSAYVANVLYGTGAAPPTASGFPIGTLYFKYTP